jgi:quinol monooxygenase YgiN
MAVTVLLELKVKPESVDTLKKLFKEILPDTRAYEGCRELKIYGNQDDAGNVVLVEHWDSRPHYEKYLAWRTETGLVDKLGSMLAGPPSIRYYEEVDA